MATQPFFDTAAAKSIVSCVRRRGRCLLVDGPPLRPNLTPQMKYMNIGSLRNEVGPLIDELMVSIQSDAGAM